MAKKQRDEQVEEGRRSRKEVLRQRKQQRQTRQIRIAVFGVVGLVVIVLLVAIVMEYFIRPRQPVAEVNSVAVTLEEWQDRVRFQRAQFIISLEDQLEAFQDVGLVQQFGQQQINLLMQPDLLGELVLEQMIDEEIIRQAAIQRGINVSDEEVDERVAANFNYFGGDSPTPVPTPTETIMPTPSLTPIPTEVITEVVPTNTPFPTPTAGPTGTPRPTATPVSEESFDENLSALLARFRDMGVDEETYRESIRAQIYRERLTEQLAAIEEVPTEAPQASLYLITTESEEEAQTILNEIETSNYIAVWNRLRSGASIESLEVDLTTATEALWRTQDQLDQQYGAEVAEAAFDLAVGAPSDILTQVGAAATVEEEPPTTYYIVWVSGREVRALSQGEIDAREQELVADLIQFQRQEGANIEIFPLWRSRVPGVPVLDPMFLVQPTQPPIPTPAAATPEAGATP